MEGNKYYKKYIEKLINANPTDIIIRRQVKTDDGYGGSTIEEIEINETVTLYDRKSRREIITDYGSAYTGVSVTKMLTKSDADIIKGDTFKVEEIEYKVLYIKGYFDICKQIELEVIL